MYDLRHYTINPNVAGKYPMADRVAEGIGHPSVESLRDYTEWFYDASFFDRLSDKDKVASMRSFDAVKSGKEWGLSIGNVLEDGMFTIDVARRRVGSIMLDAYVLSGACGADRLDGQKNCYRNLSLEKLQIIGALSVNRTQLEKEWRTVFVGETKRTEVAVGADFAGDFRLGFVYHESDAKAIEPGGSTVPFAPTVSHLLRGYHSVETGLISALLKHLATGMDESECRELFLDIIRDPTDWGRGNLVTNPFGNYADGHGLLGVMPLGSDTTGLREGHEVDSFMTSAERSRTKLSVVSDIDSVRLMERPKGPDWSTDIPELVIPDADIAGFIRAIGLSNRGRISPAEVADALRIILLNALRR